MLLELVDAGRKWDDIASELDRTFRSCSQKYYRLRPMRPAA